MIKAFLSHTSKDKDLVGKVQQYLTRENSWYDAVNIENGQSIPEKINEGLRNATHYVLFWSKGAHDSAWVEAELNAAFIRMLSEKCKFMIFTLDETPLPELIQPYKYESIDKTQLDKAAQIIAQKILSQDGSTTRLSRFVNRTSEIGKIEELAREGKKLIILSGMLGIGKYELAKRAIEWLYPNRATNTITIDFSMIPGMAELSIELSRKCNKDFLVANSDEQGQIKNIRYFIEIISESDIHLILKDVKNWLNEDGTIGTNLKVICDLIVDTNMFQGLTIMTSSRFIEIPYTCYEKSGQIPLSGMADNHIAEIINNNLSSQDNSDPEKNIMFAERLFGYPLGGKLAAYQISIHGYDYFLKQPIKIKKLNIGLAKDLISYASLTDPCQEYLKMLALTESRLRNEEYAEAFPELKDSIGKLADEAYFAGILKFNEDGCYKIEPLIADYYYDLAFGSPNRKNICQRLLSYISSQIETVPLATAFRLLPVAIHLYTLNGDVGKALSLCSDMTATIASSMWDQYNHKEYEEAGHALIMV